MADIPLGIKLCENSVLSVSEWVAIMSAVMGQKAQKLCSVFHTQCRLDKIYSDWESLTHKHDTLSGERVLLVLANPTISFTSSSLPDSTTYLDRLMQIKPHDKT